MKKVGWETDLFIFPEAGTGTLLFATDRDNMLGYCETVPDVTNGSPVVIPCDDPNYSGSSHVQMRTVSCLAKQYSVIIVVNMCEVKVSLEFYYSFPLKSYRTARKIATLTAQMMEDTNGQPMLVSFEFLLF